jgi:iron complex transport system ATP-binding protein
MKSPLLQIEKVSFAYATEPVINLASINIHEGDFIGVIGPNGSGKSTLLKLMGRMLKCASGQIHFKGKPIADYPRKTLAQSMAWIPQEHSMPFSFQVSEIVMMGRYPYLSPMTFEGQNDLDIVRKVMETTETTSLGRRRFHEISGGEKQRVILAGALAQEPEVMLLDEPTAFLDIKYQMEILQILRHLNREGNMTLVMAIHDLHLASRFCNRLMLLDKGTIVKEGSVEEVLQKEILEQVYGVEINLFRNNDGIMISPTAI